MPVVQSALLGSYLQGAINHGIARIFHFKQYSRVAIEPHKLTASTPARVLMTHTSNNATENTTFENAIKHESVWKQLFEAKLPWNQSIKALGQIQGTSNHR